MIYDIRWFIKKDGKKVLQANDGYVWYEIDTVNEDGTYFVED